ncbi:MAG TPA: hypothetical protein VN608_06360, partial [Clostridia bacterium]|nr:hypothetical protein [Clostridia bacterium]
EKGLQPLDTGETMIALRDTLLSRELNSGIDKKAAKAHCEYSNFSYKHIIITVIDSTDTSRSWRVIYDYSPDGLLYKLILMRNEVIGYMSASISLVKGNIDLSYGSKVDLPRQEISIEDYNRYMRAREAGKIAKTQRLSFKNILRYVNKPINTVTDSEYFKSLQEVVTPENYFKAAQAIYVEDGSCKLPESIEEPLMRAAYIGETDQLLQELIISSMEDMDLSSQDIEQMCLKFNEKSGAFIEPENITRQDNYFQFDYSIDPIKYCCRVYFNGWILKEVSMLYEDVEFTVRNRYNRLLVITDEKPPVNTKEG